jgi:23S rRNA pseudouridine1911/1915/1917 synthase
MKLEVLYEDDDLLIVNKPAGIPVIPERFQPEAPSLNKLLEEQRQQKIWVVHRLDRDTSGVLCFAKNETAHRYMSKVFQEHEVGKFYAGLVHGRLQQESGTIEGAIIEHPVVKGKMMVTRKGGKPSVTDYKVVEQWPLFALLQFRIYTGRTHQIRVHMQFAGHPIVADDLYGDGKPFLLSAIKKKFRVSGKDEEEKPLLNRLALHAYRLVFIKPDGKELVVESPLPRDISACINQLNKNSR